MPIFTLNSVVFPGQEFPMHIFEPRYRLMIRRCLEGDRKYAHAINWVLIASALTHLLDLA